MAIEKPIWLQNYNRPAGTEIKYINGHWYLYERLSVYDKEKKKKRKKSGRFLGTLTEKGLIPSRRHSSVQNISANEIENREYGATALLFSLTNEMRSRLAELFPDCWREIYAMALIKCKEQALFKRMDFYYQTSFLEQLLGDIPLSPGRISSLLKDIGVRRDAIRDYMKEDLPKSGIIMFDGHRLVSGSKTLEYAHLGYDSRCRFQPQINLLYMFSAMNGQRMPIFYKQYAGNVPDVTAFQDMVDDSGIRSRNATVIGDKGFESELNENMIQESGLGYVFAVRRGCSKIKEIPKHPSEYQQTFAFRGRAIYCNEYENKDSRLFLYYDMSLANDEAVDFIIRTEKTNNTIELKRVQEEKRRKKGKAKLTDEELAKLVSVDVTQALQSHKNNGTFILKTNRKDLNCVQAYYLYKSRQDIEQAFKFYDNCIENTGSYMREQYSFEAWLFINHLALQMLYKLINLVEVKGLTAKYSFRDLISFLKHVRVNKINDCWVTTKITKHTEKLCNELEIELKSPDKLTDSLN